MKLNKVLAAYLSDYAEKIAQSTEPLCPTFVAELFQLFAKVEQQENEAKKETGKESITDKAAKEILEKRQKEEMTPEECLACELMNMLGMPSDILGKVGEHTSSIKPTIKIKIKKVSSSDDLDKILKEMRNGGVVDLNSANDSLGEIFDLNSIQQIMDTPMFKQGGSMNGAPSEVLLAKLKKMYPEITDIDVLAGRKPGPNGKYLNGDGEWIEVKKKMSDGGYIEEGTTLEDFLNE